jgi:uncharacterized repeat protein (TIGR01451 family)
MKKIYSLKFLTFLFVSILGLWQNTKAQNIDTQNALSLVQKNSTKIGLSETDIQNSRVSDTYLDALSGATLVYLQQTYQGIDVDKSIKVMGFKNGNLVSASGNRISNLLMKTNTSTATAIASISAFDAVNAATINLKISAPVMISPLTQEQDASRKTEFGNMGISNNDVKAKLVWVTGKSLTGMRLCWSVQIAPVGTTDLWYVNVDAQTGTVISKENRTVNCNWNKKQMGPDQYYEKEIDALNIPLLKNKNVLAGAPPPVITSATYNAVPFPIEAPSFPGGTPAIQTNPWNLAPAGSPATTLKWNSDGTTDYDSTRGNNVLARVEHSTADDNANNAGFGAHSTTALPDLTFNSTANFTVAPNTDSTFQRFSATNLFYWNNIMHDISYQYGFDEPSGNFQENNQGRGGIGADYVFAFAQYDNGKNGEINNSNFVPTVDGTNPIMHMFLFNTTNPDRDGDVDEGVVSHEYTHGISNRFTGGPSTGGCLENAEQMGEGWSDYDAIMITTDWSKAQITDGTKPHPIGTYVLGEAPTGAGIRNYPYSTDMSIDPWTYAMIASTGGEVHNIGEIWTTVLWDMTWNIIQMDGINKDLFNANDAGGNSIAMKLVYEGMKLQPCSPGFIDGRDGILKADTLLFGGKYSCAIWAAFAKRGMGIGASEGSSNIIGDETFDFTLGNGITMTKHVNKDSADQNEVLTYTFGLKTNSSTLCGAGVPQNISIVDTLPANVTYVTGGSYNAANRTVTFSGINMTLGDTLTYSFTAIVNKGTYFTPVTFLKDNVGAKISAFWNNNSSYFTKWSVLNIGTTSNFYTYYSNDTSKTSDKQLTTASTYIVPGLITTFNFSSEVVNDAGFNGGVVEISTNNGTTWQDLGPYMSGQTYQGTILSNVSSALKGRKAFTGIGNYGATSVDLSSFAGKTVTIRFRYCTSAYTGGIITPNGGTGWVIKDILFSATPEVKNVAQFFNANDSAQGNSTAITYIKNATLPVVWGNFTAVKQGNSALLNWSTLQEINTSKFVVERSTDGLNFSAIGTVNAAGNSSAKSNYSFIDGAPLSGTDYYRLQQVDKDGNFVYSVVRTLTFDATASIIIAPNPAKDILNVTFSNNTQLLKLYLVTAQGQTLQQYTMTGQYQQLNLPQVSSGVYYLKIIDTDGNVSTHKVVIQ